MAKTKNSKKQPIIEPQRTINKRKYKDLCDDCQKWEYDCHSYKEDDWEKYKILCPNCLKKYKE